MLSIRGWWLDLVGVIVCTRPSSYQPPSHARATPQQNWDLPDPVAISADEVLDADPEVSARHKEFIEKVRALVLVFDACAISSDDDWLCMAQHRLNHYHTSPNADRWWTTW